MTELILIPMGYVAIGCFLVLVTGAARGDPFDVALDVITWGIWGPLFLIGKGLKFISGNNT